MTKAEWLTTGDGHQMLGRVAGEQFTPRKHLLLSCGCLRWHAEHNPDPAATFPPVFFAPAADNLRDWLAGAEAAADANPSAREAYASTHAGQKAHWSVSAEALAGVVRDLFAYPPGHDPFPDDWLTPTVLALAGTIDATGSFADLPYLADALEDAGCADADVLRHCRHEPHHLRGCWVLDAILRPRAGGWRDLYRADARAGAAEVPPGKVRDLLRPRPEFPGGHFLVGDEGGGYVISAWHREGGLCTLRCDDDPLYLAATERLLADGAPRFASSWEAKAAHAAGGGG